MGVLCNHSTWGGLIYWKIIFFCFASLKIWKSCRVLNFYCLHSSFYNVMEIWEEEVPICTVPHGIKDFIIVCNFCRSTIVICNVILNYLWFLQNWILLKTLSPAKYESWILAPLPDVKLNIESKCMEPKWLMDSGSQLSLAVCGVVWNYSHVKLSSY